MNFKTLKSLFRDYDLSLICVSKCDDQLMECISTCSSSECIFECNRAWAICSDCEYLFNVFKHKLLNFKLVHVILIALMAVKDARTQFASVM